MIDCSILESETVDLIFHSMNSMKMKAADATMRFVSQSDALIFDLRDNPGGGARFTTYLSSYLFDENPVHLNDYYFRASDRTLECWTAERLPGPRFPDVEVYIPINKRIFSSAEAFAYNLKHLERAPIVGERSSGGAHGGSNRRIDGRFETFVPSSRGIHPVTKEDYEGVGVEPDIDVKPENAFQVCHITALEMLKAGASLEEDSSYYNRILFALSTRRVK